VNNGEMDFITLEDGQAIFNRNFTMPKPPPRKPSLIVSAALSCLLAAAPALAQEKSTEYLIYLNPFAVQTFAQKAADEGYVRPTVPEGLTMEEKFRYVQGNMDALSYSPAVAQIKQTLAAELGLKEVGETATLIPAFYAFLTDNEYKRIRASELVAHVNAANREESGLTLSSTSCIYTGTPPCATDLTVGGETIPWGKQVINTDDSYVSPNTFYVVDANYNPGVLDGEINLVYTEKIPAGNTAYFSHPGLIMSLVGGKQNNQKTRGINPNQMLGQIGINLNPEDSINRIANIAENIDDFSVLNVSMNWAPSLKAPIKYPINFFKHNESVGKAIRRASSRLFIAESAGNHAEDACIHSFGYNSTSKINDGIMVVGGIDNGGDRYQATINPPSTIAEPRSNYGACIEAWAPGHLTTATATDGTLKTWTGTSFAAPLVAAVASRYGTSSTRPVERESYIRQNLKTAYPTAKLDVPGGLPIKNVFYGTNPSAIPPRLAPVAVYSKTSTVNLNLLSDQKFYSDFFWSANANWGSVVIDLGAPKNVKGVRIHIRSSAEDGQLDFAVHGGNTINLTGPDTPSIPTNPIAYQTVLDQFDFTSHYIVVNGNYRYLMIEGNNHNSWLAYTEIEVYGN
jgi:hypothetical protein